MRKAILVLMLAVPLAARAEEMVTKIIQVKHRPADSLARLVPNQPVGMPLSINPSRDFNTISLNGPAEKVKMAEAIIEQYDTPRRQAEFVIRVIEASSAAHEGPNDDADLVPAELKSLLRYSRYAQRDSAILRGLEADGLRIALGGNLEGYLNFRMRDDQALELHVTISGPHDAKQRPTLLETTTAAKNGETVVLGASKMQGGSSALIVLLTPKLLP